MVELAPTVRGANELVETLVTRICFERRFWTAPDIVNQHIVHDSQLFLSVHAVRPGGGVSPSVRRLWLRIHRHKYDYDEGDVDILVDAAAGVAETEG